jgi:hypothetical protein
MVASASPKAAARAERVMATLMLNVIDSEIIQALQSTLESTKSFSKDVKDHSNTNALVRPTYTT